MRPKIKLLALILSTSCGFANTPNWTKYLIFEDSSDFMIFEKYLLFFNFLEIGFEKKNIKIKRKIKNKAISLKKIFEFLLLIYLHFIWHINSNNFTAIN
jgi:hypothetical protein